MAEVAHTVSGFDAARHALRARTLRQALYDEGAALMGDVIVNLHGDEHVGRRRLENRLFRRDTFEMFETQRLPSILDAAIRPAIAIGRGDLLDMARRAMTELSIDVAGIDLGPQADDGEPAAFEHLYELMASMARAATVVHATGDKERIIDDGQAALAEFDAAFFATSERRRAAAVAQYRRGELAESDLERDVLTTLLRNADDLDLPRFVILREVAYYPWVGAHSTSVQLVHAMHHLFEWCDARPDDRDALSHDDQLRQRFVHESLRLHPASPVAWRVAADATELLDGTEVAPGERVTIDIESANRDPGVFGKAPAEFDPFRKTRPDVAPWGLSFGSGMHSCLGRELAAGVAEAQEGEARLLGSIDVMAGILLRAGARPDPDAPAVIDRSTSRAHFERYPVMFGDECPVS